MKKQTKRTECTKHEWVSIVKGEKTWIECGRCGEKPPPVRRVVKLTVINRTTKCPYGVVKGRVPLHDCYLDSITPGHRCNDPKHEGARRCPHVKKLIKERGLRTYDIVPMLHTARHGVLHKEWPLKLIYSPLDLKGLDWMAVNVHTGQRHHVVLHSEHPQRRTPEGDDILQQFNHVNIVMRGKMADVMQRPPPWNGVPSRDEFKCDCINCKEKVIPMTTILRGVHMEDEDTEKKDKKVIKVADAPSAPQPFGALGRMFKEEQPATLSPPVWQRDRHGVRFIGPDKSKPEGQLANIVKRKAAQYTIEIGEVDAPMNAGAVLSTKVKKNKEQQQDERRAGMRSNFGTLRPKPAKLKKTSAKSDPLPTATTKIKVAAKPKKAKPPAKKQVAKKKGKK